MRSHEYYIIDLDQSTYGQLLYFQVPWFKAMDDRLLDALCARLKPALYTENSYIVREGEPLEDMVFIMRGKLTSTTTYGGKSGFFNSVSLGVGQFCGDLLTWALDPNTSHFPISTSTVQAQTEVEGFVLSADDLKFVATQYRRINSKQLRHMFRQDLPIQKSNLTLNIF